MVTASTSVAPGTAPATSVSPTSRRMLRSGRGPAIVGGLVLLGALVIAWATSGGRVGFLDPDAVSPTGSKAVAEVLRDQGVEVIRAAGIAEATQAGPGDSLLLSFPDLLTVEQARELASTDADLIVVGASREDIVSALAPGLSTLPGERPKVRDPSCDLGAAVRAGNALTGGTAYSVAPGTLDAVGCYPVAGNATVVQITVDGQRIVFLGFSGPLENDLLAQDGNAALALGLLGANPRLVWQMSSPDDFPIEEQATFWELVPVWFIAALLQVAFAVLLIALWRGRRLGPVVVEPLPVVVRAAEAAEGRGRMYQRAGARDLAAERLRSATRDRLGPLVGLSRRADPVSLATAVVSRTGRTGPEVQGLLYGGPPPDDAALVRLADDLDALERQVRHP